MSQRAHEQPNPRNAPTAERKQQNPPVTDGSPDDPFPVDPTDPTGKPGQQAK